MPHQVEKQQVQSDPINYTVKHLKTVKDANGNEVQIIDRTETTTIEQLNQRIADYNSQITALGTQKAEVQGIIDDIKELE